MKAMFSFFFSTFYFMIILFMILSVLVLFFERKFMGIAQKSLGMSFLGRNGWIHLPADMVKFWSKNSFKSYSLWGYSNMSIFMMLATYYIWNLISVTFFVNNQNMLNFDFSAYQILLYLGYANLTSLYLFFIMLSLKSKYALMGGLRMMLSSMFLEFSFMLNYYILYIYSGGFSFNDFVFVNSWSSYLFMMPISSLIFFIYVLYEAKSAPFDHAEAESELVAGHIIEFSGKSLLFFFFSEYIHLYFCIYLIFLFIFGTSDSLTFLQFFFFFEPLYDVNTQYLLPMNNIDDFL